MELQNQTKDVYAPYLSNDIMLLILKARKDIERLASLNEDITCGPGLAGYCGIISRYLIDLMELSGISGASLCCGRFNKLTHCWVEYGGFCLDLSISQFLGFAKKKYKICRVGDCFYSTYYENELDHRSAIEYQKTWGIQAYETYQDKLLKTFNS